MAVARFRNRVNPLLPGSSERRTPPARSREIVDALMAAKKNVCYLEIDAPQGHDAFLVDIARFGPAVREFLESL